MTSYTINHCRNPQLPHWQLGPPPRNGVLDLIGWRVEPSPVFGGVPARVAEILAVALTKVAYVTYRTSPADNLPSQRDGDDTVDLVTELPRGLLETVRGSRYLQISTRNKQGALALFDDAAFPWWNGVQVAMLSDPSVTPPVLKTRDWNALLEERWTDDAYRLAPAGLIAVLRAGVDGDVAGSWSNKQSFADALLTSLRTEAEAAGFGWDEVVESDF